MQEGRGSETAKLTAMMRAVHVLTDPPPCIFYDELGAKLCGLSDQQSVLAAAQQFEAELARVRSASLAKAWMRAGRLSVALRARYAEDELAKAVERGVTQYVILGAGYDTYAYCRRDTRLQVFELDHRDTQQAKLKALQTQSIAIPPGVVLVEIDFREQTIGEVLRNSGYRPDKPACFVWLGVTAYLSDEAIERVLRQVACAANGSSLVLDYMLPDPLLNDEERQISYMAKATAGARDEDPDNYIAPDDMLGRLTAAGFSNVSNLDNKKAHALYCADRSDGLRFQNLINVAMGHVMRS